MVYMGNIIQSQLNMNDDELICLMFKSGRKAYIHKNWKLERVHGDLKITGETSARCFIDCAEIEQIIIAKEQVIRKGD